MKIFMIVGMPASGKNLARAYAEANHLPYFAPGDRVNAGTAEETAAALDRIVKKYGPVQ